VQRDLADQPLSAAHSIMVSRASAEFPMKVVDEEGP
jgi:hypothetical protein